jgi:hypothetical protein
VYHVREVLAHKPISEDGHSLLGRMDFDDSASRRSSVEYGREYAIKCLSKANLDEEALEAQTFEVSNISPRLMIVSPSILRPLSTNPFPLTPTL